MSSPAIYAGVRKGTVTLYPENLHLLFESSYDSDYCYFVNSTNNKQLIKMNVTDRSTSVIETRTVDIARGYLDRNNDILYLVDCDYSGTGTSYIWSIDLSDDSITEISSFPNSDIWDVWIYDSDIWVYYFINFYELLTGNINPNGDIISTWTSTGGNHFTEIDEGLPPNTGDYISMTGTVEKTDSFTMGTIDMSGYDSAGVVDQVYQIKCYLYIYSSVSATIKVSGNKTGLTEQSQTATWIPDRWIEFTWSDLSLDQADLDDLEITLKGTASTPAGGIIVSTMYCKIYHYGDTQTSLNFKNITDEVSYSNNMGAVTGRSYDSSQICNAGTNFYFLWHWSNENVELWRFRTVETDFTQMADAGSTTELPLISMGALAVDNTPDYMYFILQTGTKEVSTIVADTQANITDETYFTITVISLDYENERSEYTINCWFDKAGDSTWTADPADADENIQIDISGDVSAQDVSDTITAALNAHELVTATNGSGTSTTVTITNHYNGNVTNINAQDSGLSVATTTPGVDGTNYLFTYSIVDDALTNIGIEYNIALMLQRNTNSSASPEFFALEKAFGTQTGASGNALKVFQISRIRGAMNFLGQFYLTYPTDTYANAKILAITDHFIFMSDGEGSPTYTLWQFEDIIDELIVEGKIYAEVRKWYEANLMWLKKTGYQDPPVQNQFIQIFGRFSSYTLGNPYYADNALIFEGVVRYIDKDVARNISIKSLIKEELENISPNISDYTDYTGKTSGQIITQLISDYCSNITAGTIANGTTTWTCPDDWKAQGDKSLFEIFNEFADTEFFHWYLHPNGALDFNDGSVNSQKTFATTDTYYNPSVELISQQINRVELMGGFVQGVQVGPVTSDDLEHQKLYGNIIIWSKTYASVLDATILQTLADNKLELQGEAPLMYYAERKCSSDWGFQLIGELSTLQALQFSEGSDETLTAGTYILNRNTFDIKNQTSDLKFSDGMLFQEDASQNLPEQNSQLIQQTASTVREIARPNTTSLSPDHTAEGCIVTLTAGENLIFGEVCYFKSDGKCWKADSSATTTMPVSFMALGTISADATGSFLVWGTVRDDTWNWTVGGLIYISSTAGALSQTAPAGEEIQVCGIALSADIMLFFLNFQYSSDLAFAAAWDSRLQIPTMNSIYDAFKHGGTEGVARIKTGTYTGNGAGDADGWVTYQQITISSPTFSPKYVRIVEWTTGSAVEVWAIDANPSTQTKSFWWSGANICYSTQSLYQLKLGTNCFYVNDQEADNHPNKNGTVYYYIAIG